MKAKYIFQILPLLLAFSLAGCSQEDITSTEEANEYNVSLKFNGEIVSTESPLTRGTTTEDLIGVQVYQDGVEYAHGLFDNTDDININVFSDHKYKFIVTIVKNGKNNVYYYSLSKEYTGPGKTYEEDGYSKPFISYGKRLDRPSEYESGVVWGYTNTKLLNSFTYTDKGYSDKILGFGETTMTDGKTYSYPATDRFYGELDNFTPTEDGSVSIDLKRAAFGLKYEVSGVTDGAVTIKIKKSNNITFFENSTITADYESEEKIFTFSDVYSAWKYAKNGYTENITISASWARGVGITEDLGSKAVQIKRNVMNIIRLKLGSVDYDGNIGIEVEEETDMEEETVTGTLE